jgi:hypothetical protein
MKKYINSIIACTCFFFYSCEKQGPENVAMPRLQKIISNGVDSLGNLSSAPLSFQFFTYDVNGNLVSIRDSSEHWHGWYTGPQPWRLDKKLFSMEYNFYGNLIRTWKDSFVYNNRNQLTARLKRNLDNQSYVMNAYTYDVKGRLIADSGYVNQSVLNPKGVLYGYDLYTYDGNDNVILDDRYDFSPPGSSNVKHTTYTATYDNKKSPYKGLGLLPYLLFYYHGFFLSAGNVMEPGYTYEYYANGLLKRISYQGFVQECFYE